MIISLILIVLLLFFLAPFLPIIFSVLLTLGKIIVKCVIWLFSLPFKLIKKHKEKRIE